MKPDLFRWLLLPVAAAALLVMLFSSATPGRVALFAVCAAAWYGLSRRKTYSLDRDRFKGGKLGRRP